MNPRIIVHWLERSRAQRIIWLLEELSLKYDIKTYKRDAMGGCSDLKKIHPLGLSPLVTIEGDRLEKPVVLAESGAIIDYLCRNFGQSSTLVPQQFPAGEKSAGLETEAWRRSLYYLHYTEGTFMPLPPFPVSLLTRVVTGKLDSDYLVPRFNTHYEFLESQLKTSGGAFLCGPTVSVGDIMMGLALQAAQLKAPVKMDRFPLLETYIKELEALPSYKKAVEKIIEIEGKYEVI